MPIGVSHNCTVLREFDFPLKYNIISDGYRIKNNIVEEKKDLDKAIKEFLKCEESFLLNVIVEKEENVFPMVPSGESVSNIRLE